MSKRGRTPLSVAVLLLSSVGAWAQSGSPGHIYFSKLANTALDTYTNSPDAATQSWLRTHFSRMGVYTPYFDTRTSWFPNGMVYVNLYGILPQSQLRYSHPEWIAHDQYGNWLYIPFNCSGGTCPQYAGDVSNPAFRAWWISNAGSILNQAGYLGLWIDDVNMEFRVSDGWGNQVPPMDSATGQPMTWDAWRNYIAQFLGQIRSAFPNTEIMENTIWFAGPDGIRDADPAIQRQIASASNLNLERGIGSDLGLTGGTGQWSIYAFFAYVDRVHAAGKNVTMQEYVIDRVTQQYAVAGYYLISNGSDRYGDGGTDPSNWWSLLDTELGTPLGPRSYNNGVFQRSFTNGMVLVGEPGLATQTIQLPGTFTTVDGTSVTSVTLSARQGIILIGTGATTTATSQVTHYVSDLTPTYVYQSWGSPQHDLSIGGSPLNLNGTVFSKGLGVHAYSEVRYALSGSCSALTAKVGIDSEIPVGLGSAAFQVWADGLKLFDSGTMTSGSAAANVNVNLTGYQSLSLVMTNGIYDAPAWAVPCDHGDWANAILTCTH